MNIRKAKILSAAGAVLLLVSILIGCAVTSDYESAYPKTASGEIEVKTIPESVVLQSKEDGVYYDKSNKLFMKLFNYIKANKIPMTVPVESGIRDAEMRFYVSSGKKDADLKATDAVKVLRMPERLVVSAGGRGSYSEDNMEDARLKLDKWLAEHPEYGKDGEAYAVYWNSPFVPWFLRRYEVHLPVKKR